MTNPKIAPYGTWKSPITSDLIVKETVGLSQPRIDGEDIYWIEMRPPERGRQVIVRHSADGSRLALLNWNHQNMPWDGCELWVGESGDVGSIKNQKLVAGGLRESIFQPEFSPDGLLYFVSDRSGWWNVYRAGDTAIECV